MLYLHACMHTTCVPVGSPEIGVIDDYKPPCGCGCRESNPCPLKEQQAFLTAEPALRPRKIFKERNIKSEQGSTHLLFQPSRQKQKDQGPTSDR